MNSFVKIKEKTKEEKKMEKLKELFEEIIDVRDSSGKRHCLTHIMVISVCGILNKCIDFEDIVDYAKAKKKWFDKHLNLWNGIPSPGTFRNVFRVIKAENFLEIFLKWINEIIREKTGKQIIIDGKAIRAATEKCTNGNIPYIVSAYLADIGISIGQVKVDEKSSEVTAIPELIELLDIEGCIITIDAIGATKKIMDQIKENKGNFVIALKDNHHDAYKEIREYYEDSLKELDLKELSKSKLKKENKQYENKDNEKFDIYITRDNEHGRKEERIYIKSSNVKWFTSSKWKHVKSVVMAINNTTVHDNKIRYFVSSIDLPAEELGKIIRKHWQIENNLHWVLDMYFYEDLSRNRKDNALENLSLVRKICYNMIKLDTRYDKVNKNGNLTRLSTKRKMNRYVNYPKEFEELLFQVLPQAYGNNW